MKVVALIKNTKLEDRGSLVEEHGLSLHIDCDDKHILFDTGATKAFGQNAVTLGVNLQEVDALVVSPQRIARRTHLEMQ